MKNGENNNSYILDTSVSVENGKLMIDGKPVALPADVAALPYSPQYVRTVTMCVLISAACNLNCKYCFGKRNAVELTFDDVQRFIETVVAIYPRADRYTVDMSGAGEPLLQKEMIFKFADYCKVMSDKYVREFLPTFVTNGTLLDGHTVERLQSAGVLFGISLDGAKKVHDKNRVFADGKGSYDTVVKNISAIKHRDYVGAACTYSDGSLYDSYLHMVDLLPTVSMKPVRYEQGNIDIDGICAAYEKLARYILTKTIEGEHRYLFAILNGDDYFGKFIKRVALKRVVYGRCEAGIGRFALAGDKKIYCCPAGVGIAECEVGDLENGIRRNKIEKTWKNLLNDKCAGCYARSACGGECKIVSYNKFGSTDKVDETMCKIKRYLYVLATVFCERLKDDNKKEYDWMLDVLQQTENYYTLDERLVNAVNKSNGKYTFSQLKKIKDTDNELFDKIYADLFSESTLKGGDDML